MSAVAVDRPPRAHKAWWRNTRAHLLFERNLMVYRRSWLTLVSGFFEPIFYLFSLGIGLGHFVGHVHGVSYASYIAPALLASSAMNGAVYDGMTLAIEPGLVERWEAFCGGIEIANAFTELNDPDEQRARFEAQARYAAEGDEDAAPYDEIFVEALEHGMPPTGGVGLGIDRLVMALRDRSSIREVVLFPAMRD